jgi:hypothetical protein
MESITHELLRIILDTFLAEPSTFGPHFISLTKANERSVLELEADSARARFWLAKIRQLLKFFFF